MSGRGRQKSHIELEVVDEEETLRAHALHLRGCLEVLVRDIEAKTGIAHPGECHCPFCAAKHALSVTSGLV